MLLTKLKYLLESFLALFKTSAKYEEKTLAEKIDERQAQVKSAIGVFQQALESVEDAQAALKEVKNEATATAEIVKAKLEQELAELQAVIDKADKEAASNDKVKAKLSEFVGGALSK